MRKIVLAVTALLLVALDQLSKFFVVKYIRLGTIVEFIPNLVSLTYLRNSAVAIYGDNFYCFRSGFLLLNQTDANAEFLATGQSASNHFWWFRKFH